MQEKSMEQAAAATRRLYYEDGYKKEFTATVLSCAAYKDGYRVTLDGTAFFPEGGGQAGDEGWLCMPEINHADIQYAAKETIQHDMAGAYDTVEACDTESRRGAAHDAAENEEKQISCDTVQVRDTESGRGVAYIATENEEKQISCDAVRVRDTREKGGVIFHMTDRPLAVGAKVIGRLDFEKRFERMQQHSGEHIISGIVHRLYGLDNVGFHLGETITTLDFNGELSEEQVRMVEKLANQAVFENIPIEVAYPSKEALAVLEYRSKIEIEGQVRIVTIGDVDRCACCAPHVKRTGEIGLIKLLSCDRHRGGCRMVMVSGIRALADYVQKQESVTQVSVALSAKPEAVGEAVLRQKEQMQRLREHLNRLQASYLAQRLEELREDQQNVCIFLEDFDQIAVRNFINEAVKRCSGICAAFIGTGGDSYHYIISGRQTDVREIARELSALFGGKGGGKPEMVQGSLCAKQEEISAFFRKLQ